MSFFYDFRRIEEVLKCLGKSSKLAQAIALKRKTPKLGNKQFTVCFKNKYCKDV